MHSVFEATAPTSATPLLGGPSTVPQRLQIKISRFPASAGARTVERDDRARRALNVTVAVLALILCAPLMLVIAVLIKLTSPGPILYTQTRVGIDRRTPIDLPQNRRRMVDFGGKLFRIYKFRSMHVSSDRLVQTWAKPNDSRVTRFGAFLRRTRLDELPQLFNVLKGDMNMVGPRPEQPNIFMTLRVQVEGYQERQRVLPGITGWAQINHPYDLTVDDVRKKLMYDLQYIERHSAMYDLRILLQTLPVILLRRGAW